MRATLTYRFDDGEHLELEAVRVTVGTGSMRVIGTHSRLVRLASEIAEAENKAEFEDEVAAHAAGVVVAAVVEAEGQGEEDDEAEMPSEPAGAGERPEDVVRVNLYRRWALLSAVTRSIQVVRRSKKLKELDPEDPDKWPWQDSSMEGLGWDKPGPVIDLPADLFTSWELYAQRVNPGTFGPPLTGSTKKNRAGLISVI